MEPLPPREEPSKVQKRTFGVLFAAASVLFLWTVSPIWVPVFLGILLAVVATPLERRLERRFGGHPRLLAALITCITLAVGVGVVALVGLVIVRELLQFFSGPDQLYAAQASEWLHSRRAERMLVHLGTTPDHVIETARHSTQSLVGHLSDILSGLLTMTSRAVITLIFTGITSYYLLLDGAALRKHLLRLLPLPLDETRSLMTEFRQSSVGILLSIGVVGVFQAVTAGLAFLICGVPKPLVWGALTGVVSLIPAVGTALVCVPVGILQIATGHLWSGVGVLVIWLVVVIGIADYILRPRMMRGRVKMPDLLVLIGVFGGIEAFGVIGLALGPLFVALFVALLRIYDRDYRTPRPMDASPTT